MTKHSKELNERSRKKYWALYLWFNIYPNISFEQFCKSIKSKPHLK